MVRFLCGEVVKISFIWFRVVLRDENTMCCLLQSSSLYLQEWTVIVPAGISERNIAIK